MNLAGAISDLNKVSQVPLLKDAAQVALYIVKTVQVHRNNSAKLQQLALTIVGQLHDLSDQMNGKWDGSPDALKRKIDGFVGILEAVSRRVDKQAQTSLLASLLTAHNRNNTIKALDTQLKNAYDGIQLFLVIDNAIKVEGLAKRVKANEAMTTSARLAMQDVQTKLNEPRAVTSYYTRTDFYLQRTIMQNSIRMASGGEVTIVLREATLQANKETVLIKTYEGNAAEKQQLFKGDLSHAHETCQDPTSPSISFKGSSSPEINIPFQVYESPDPMAHDEASLKRFYEQLVRSYTATTTSMWPKSEETLKLDYP